MCVCVWCCDGLCDCHANCFLVCVSLAVPSEEQATSEKPWNCHRLTEPVLGVCVCVCVKGVMD